MCLLLTNARGQPCLIKDNACDRMKNSIYVPLVRLSRISNEFQKRKLYDSNTEQSNHSTFNSIAIKFESCNVPVSIYVPIYL